jgi:hypothetical protein
VTTSGDGEQRTTTAEETASQSRGEKACGWLEFHSDDVEGLAKPAEARRRQAQAGSELEARREDSVDSRLPNKPGSRRGAADLM